MGAAKEPATLTLENTPIARPRRARGTRSARAAVRTAVVKAFAKPWPKRPARNQGMLGARPQSADVSAKPRKPIPRARRREVASESAPETIWKPANGIM